MLGHQEQIATVLQAILYFADPMHFTKRNSSSFQVCLRVEAAVISSPLAPLKSPRPPSSIPRSFSSLWHVRLARRAFAVATDVEAVLDAGAELGAEVSPGYRVSVEQAVLLLVSLPTSAASFPVPVAPSRTLAGFFRSPSQLPFDAPCLQLQKLPEASWLRLGWQPPAWPAPRLAAWLFYQLAVSERAVVAEAALLGHRGTVYCCLEELAPVRNDFPVQFGHCLGQLEEYSQTGQEA